MRSTKQRRFLQRLRTAATIGHAMPSHSLAHSPIIVHIAMRRWAAGGCRTAARLVFAGTLYAACTRHAVASRCCESAALRQLCSRDDRVAVEALRSYVVDACRNGLGDLYTLSQAITRPSHGHRIAVGRSEQITQAVLHEY